MKLFLGCVYVMCESLNHPTAAASAAADVAAAARAAAGAAAALGVATVAAAAPHTLLTLSAPLHASSKMSVRSYFSC